jgi:hypothetical protein
MRCNPGKQKEEMELRAHREKDGKLKQAMQEQVQQKNQYDQQKVAETEEYRK